ncbi:unnamed protein product [Rangifer tarandus platyrhynchus]|uniref:Uncharacterized protein n=2 Tax=Rangifer tarandus platyrhynchus TaxID=3082113 RepID=A0ABN8YVP4_RANTA|nr:unnamed protein product [Rangifer tarandus platyrhynchus]
MSTRPPLFSIGGVGGGKSLDLRSEKLGSNPASTTDQLCDVDQILQPFESQREQKARNERSLLKIRSPLFIPQDHFPNGHTGSVMGLHCFISVITVTATLYQQPTVYSKERKVESLSHVWLFVTPWTVACQAPLFMGFSRQEHWSGLPFPPPGDLPGPGIKPGCPTLQADALHSEPPGK